MSFRGIGASGLSVSRQRLLDAARGLFLDHHSKTADAPDQRRILRFFPLRENQFRDSLKTPEDFHSTLIRKISSAKRRVYLASLYIGPAADPVASHKEAQLLEGLRSTQASDIKILLDRNRALRPVPVFCKEQRVATVTSADACYSALQQNVVQARRLAARSGKEDGESNPFGVYLLSVLPRWLQWVLPNPYNEVAGVFHLKCYIVDDDLILTGANLSEEYFCDRTDRYLWITSNSVLDAEKDYRSCLVECYAALVNALCEHAEPYNDSAETLRTTRTQLLATLSEILTVDPTTEGLPNSDVQNDGFPNMRTDHIEELEVTTSDPIVAYAVPTLQLPASFQQGLTNTVPDDVAVTNSLITTLAHETRNSGNSSTCELRLASAYLNLTSEMVRSMTDYANIHLLTAGSMSHGFKVNPAKVGNKGKAWIPAVFDALGRIGVGELSEQFAGSKGAALLWYYQRKEWTFHAKGLWLSTKSSSSWHGHEPKSSEPECDNLAIGDESRLCVVTHGSGNYGYRSAMCDMESNLILVLPDTVQSTSVHAKLKDDWNQMVPHTSRASSETPQPLFIQLRVLLPFIRRFF
jgi:CDP-diacylglycerol---glycerol-3-phosphate 3-phosphatidyltransferase